MQLTGCGASQRCARCTCCRWQSASSKNHAQVAGLSWSDAGRTHGFFTLVWYRPKMGSKGAFAHDAALPCDSACALPPNSSACEVVGRIFGTSGGSTPKQAVEEHQAAEPVMRAASPFAAESLASASSAVSLCSSVSADELQVCCALILAADICHPQACTCIWMRLPLVLHIMSWLAKICLQLRVTSSFTVPRGWCHAAVRSRAPNLCNILTPRCVTMTPGCCGAAHHP